MAVQRTIGLLQKLDLYLVPVLMEELASGGGLLPAGLGLLQYLVPVPVVMEELASAAGLLPGGLGLPL